MNSCCLNKEIYITAHAIQRFKERLFYLNIKDEKEIEKTLIRTLRKGKIVKKRKSKINDICYQDIYIVVAEKKDRYVIITCLGDKAWYNWLKKTNTCKKAG